MEEEKRELLDRMLTWLEYHDIRSLIEIVLETINIHEDENVRGNSVG